jgi:hypothetical protein
MEEIQLEKPIRGFVFACTNKTEDECLARANRIKEVGAFQYIVEGVKRLLFLKS